MTFSISEARVVTVPGQSIKQLSRELQASISLSCWGKITKVSKFKHFESFPMQFTTPPQKVVKRPPLPKTSAVTPDPKGNISLYFT